MGIPIRKQWHALGDNRTRDWHREIDGQVRELDKPFENAWGKIMRPGDPTAAAANIYNCRCNMLSVIDGHELDASYIYQNNHKPELEGISYEEWKKGKADEGTVDFYFNLKDEELKKYYGTLDNKTVRMWYKRRNQTIPYHLDKTTSLKEQAIDACDRRNANKQLARELMADKEERKILDANEHPKTFDDLITRKKTLYNMTEEEAYRDIIRSSATTNPYYDRKAGL